jgi:hypothetical protein
MGTGGAIQNLRAANFGSSDVPGSIAHIELKGLQMSRQVPFLRQDNWNRNCFVTT